MAPSNALNVIIDVGAPPWDPRSAPGEPGALSSLTANGSPLLTDGGVALLACNQPTLGISRTPSGVLITFTGKLESAPSLTGPWNEMTGATTPYTAPTASGQMFFRAKN